MCRVLKERKAEFLQRNNKHSTASLAVLVAARMVITTQRARKRDTDLRECIRVLKYALEAVCPLSKQKEDEFARLAARLEKIQTRGHVPQS